MQTKFGKIAQNLSVIDDTQTPLQKIRRPHASHRHHWNRRGCRRLYHFLSARIGVLPSFSSCHIFSGSGRPRGTPRGHDHHPSMGVKEMSNRRSIIRKLSAIEALGSVTLIATDKTGTLTTNKMKVKEAYVNGQITNFQVPITKQVSISNFQLPNDNIDAFSLMILDGILCSTASLVYVHDHGSYDVLGDPTEGALLYLAHEVGLKPDEVRKEWKIIEEMPFDSVTKRMSVVVNNQGEARTPHSTIYFFKRSPESILEISKVTLKKEIKLRTRWISGRGKGYEC